MRERSCEGCRYWQHYSEGPDYHTNVGLCRARPPYGVTGAPWPTTDATDWCGGFWPVDADYDSDLIAVSESIDDLVAEVRDLRHALCGQDRETIEDPNHSGELAFIARAVGRLVSSGDLEAHGMHVGDAIKDALFGFGNIADSLEHGDALYSIAAAIDALRGGKRPAPGNGSSATPRPPTRRRSGPSGVQS